MFVIKNLDFSRWGCAADDIYADIRKFAKLSSLTLFVDLRHPKAPHLRVQFSSTDVLEVVVHSQTPKMQRYSSIFHSVRQKDSLSGNILKKYRLFLPFLFTYELTLFFSLGSSSHLLVCFYVIKLSSSSQNLIFYLLGDTSVFTSERFLTWTYLYCEWEVG